MKSFCTVVGVLAGCGVVGATLVCVADWPQWRGPNRDAKISGFTAPQTWPKTLPEKWKAEVGSADATPALVGGKLYVFSRQGDEEVISCLNAADGKPIWQDKYAPGATVTGPAGPHPGPRSSPAVADGKVVTFGVGGVLSCLDAESGKVLWRKETAKEFPPGWPRFYTASSPMIVEGVCIAQLGGPGKGAVVAVDMASGEFKWKSAGDGPAYASPMLMTVEGAKQLVVQTDKNLIGLALSDGKPLWKIPTPTARMAQNAVSPVIDGDTVIFSGQGTGTKAVKIEKEGDGYAAKDLWKNERVTSTFSTCVLKDGLLFGLSASGNYFCLDAKTGKTLWTDTAKHGERGFGSIIDAGSVLIAMTYKSELVAFEPSKTGYVELANIKLSETPTYAHPVIEGKQIIVEDQKSVAAFAIE
jgi:outer membrane protein assembly factor BamB